MWRFMRHSPKFTGSRRLAVSPITRLDEWWTKKSPARRLDFNLGNLMMLIGLLLPSFSIVVRGPNPASVIAEMSVSLQVMMCACIFGGCALKLHGAMAGRRFWFPNMSLKRCYQFGYTGAPAATAGCLVYGYYLVTGNPDFWVAMGAVSTPIFGIGISGQAILYWLEVRRISRNEVILTEIHNSEPGADER